MTTLREAAEAGMKPDQITEDLAMTARNAINYIIKLERERDALLEALKEAVEVCIWPSTAFSNAFDKARAAIAKAEGEKT